MTLLDRTEMDGNIYDRKETGKGLKQVGKQGVKMADKGGLKE